MRRAAAGILAFLYAIACADVGAIAASSGTCSISDTSAIRAQGGGRRLLVVTFDSNRDGRSDVEEYYGPDGGLIRRDSDRNFNGQVDLVEEFDAATHEQQRAVADLDFDGLADVLVLYQAGQAVFVKRAPPVTAARPAVFPSAFPAETPIAGRGSLNPLNDPFEGDNALNTRPGLTSPQDVAAVVPVPALPALGIIISVPLDPPRLARASHVSRSQSPTVSSPSLRGPPRFFSSSV